MRQILALFIALTACAPPTHTKQEDQSVCACGPDLTAEDVSTLTEQANGGDLQAAATLSVWFANQGDQNREHYWLEFGARHGDCNSMAVLFDEVQGQLALREELRHLAATSHCPPLDSD